MDDQPRRVVNSSSLSFEPHRFYYDQIYEDVSSSGDREQGQRKAGDIQAVNQQVDVSLGYVANLFYAKLDQRQTFCNNNNNRHNSCVVNHN